MVIFHIYPRNNARHDTEYNDTLCDYNLIVLFITHHTTLLPISLHLYRSRVHILVQTHA